MEPFFSLICLLMGGGLALWVKRRQFARLNQCGVEEFESFRAKMIATAIEKIAWGLALFFILAGSLLALSTLSF